jgi:hypothetical protein
MAPFESSEVWLLRRNRLLLAAALSPLFLGPAALVWGAQDIGDVKRAVALTVGIIAPLVGIVTSLYVIRASPLRVALRGPLTAGEDGLHFSGRRLARLRDLRAGFVVPSWGKPPRVRLERRFPRGPIELRTRDDAEGHALLEALGLGASQVVADFTFASRARASNLVTALGWTMLVLVLVGIPILASAVADPTEWAGLGVLIGVLLLIVWLVVMSLPTRVAVGSDGVLVSWFWRRRFLRYAEVRAVRPYGSGSEQGVGIWSGNGEVVKLPIKAQLTQELNDQQTELVTQRIQQAISGHAQRRSGALPRLPEPGDRPAVEWIRALRAAGSGANADHRTAPLAPEELFRVVEDPGAEPLARASAAVAVGGGLGAEGRSRLRVAAQATASPEVRRLLALAAEDDVEEEVLARALQRLRAR